MKKGLVQVVFVKVWGHPTKNQIWGPSDGVIWMTEDQAATLERQGYVERVTSRSK